MIMMKIDRGFMWVVGCLLSGRSRVVVGLGLCIGVEVEWIIMNLVGGFHYDYIMVINLIII